jgi:hypothetical protein
MDQTSNLPSPSDFDAEVRAQQASLAKLPIGTERRTMQICAGSPVPNGWIKVDDDWSPTSCGSPTSITYNVWTIETFNDKPLETTMEVCSVAPTPRGWVEVDSFWSPTRCGHPTAIVHNIKRIRRVS